MRRSKLVETYEAAVERQRGVSERWRLDWEERGREVSDLRMKLARYELAQAHTDANGRRFIYVDTPLLAPVREWERAEREST